jgi:hypothetical protein
MEEPVFWELLGQICDMGDLVATTENNGASADVAGLLRTGYAGGETVLERPQCHCHVHVYLDNIAQLAFTYRDIGRGPEPCLEVMSWENEPVVRLYYRGGGDARAKYAEFARRNTRHADQWNGSW